jgi:hypothetical protein
MANVRAQQAADAARAAVRDAYHSVAIAINVKGKTASLSPNSADSSAGGERTPVLVLVREDFSLSQGAFQREFAPPERIFADLEISGGQQQVTECIAVRSKKLGAGAVGNAVYICGILPDGAGSSDGFDNARLLSGMRRLARVTIEWNKPFTRYVCRLFFGRSALGCLGAFFWTRFDPAF